MSNCVKRRNLQAIDWQQKYPATERLTAIVSTDFQEKGLMKSRHFTDTSPVRLHAKIRKDRGHIVRREVCKNAPFVESKELDYVSIVFGEANTWWPVSVALQVCYPLIYKILKRPEMVAKAVRQGLRLTALSMDLNADSMLQILAFAITCIHGQIAPSKILFASETASHFAF